MFLIKVCIGADFQYEISADILPRRIKLKNEKMKKGRLI